MMGLVKIIKPGIFTTVQDEGRFGFSKYGVPKSGAMDLESLRFANLLLGNDKNCACIEWTFQAPVLQFSEATSIALTGAPVDAFLNGEKIKMYHQTKVGKNDILVINFCKNKIYGYVGIKDGFSSSIVLDSRSYYGGITAKKKLSVGDGIAYKKQEYFKGNFSGVSASFFAKTTKVVEVYPGPEYESLSIEQKRVLTNSVFTISNTINRMAIQLEEKLKNSISSIITSPVLPGTVQLTPSGNLIVLMRDCQTTGGYPRVLQLTENTINQIAQKRMGEKFNFVLVNF